MACGLRPWGANTRSALPGPRLACRLDVAQELGGRLAGLVQQQFNGVLRPCAVPGRAGGSSGSRNALGNPDHVVYHCPPVSESMPLPPDPPPVEGTQPGPSALPELRRMLPELMLADQHRLRRHADRAGGLRDPNARDKAIAKLASDIERARLRVDARRKAVPVICYPEELPVSQRKDDIAQAIRDHQVVIIAGETGSGKTTQIPKICLEARPRHHRADRAHPAAADRRAHRRRADRRGAGHATRRRRRVQGPVHGQGDRRHARQADDGRHPARRDGPGPGPAQVRHADHRRGARAQPEHRLHPRLPAPAAAAKARPQGHHHQRDDRPGTLR